MSFILTWQNLITWILKCDIWVKPGRSLRGQKKVFFSSQLQRVILTWYYLLWDSRWFLSNKYAEGTNLKRLSGLFYLLNLAKTPLNLLIMIFRPCLMLVHGYTYNKSTNFFLTIHKALGIVFPKHPLVLSLGKFYLGKLNIRKIYLRFLQSGQV